MAGNGVKISLTPGMMPALLSASVYMQKEFRPSDNWNALLMCHLVDMRNNLAKRIIDQKTKSLNLSPKEAYAYWLLWMQVDLGTSTFNVMEKQAIQYVLDTVDQYIKSNKPLEEYEQNILT